MYIYIYIFVVNCYNYNILVCFRKRFHVFSRFFIFTPRWCKVDSPDLSEVEEWLKLPEKGSSCGDRSVCAPLVSDKRFYPQGIPKVFVSLRFSSDLKRSEAVLATATKRYKKKTLPNPILYYTKTYATSRAAKKDWPEIPCLLGV